MIVFLVYVVAMLIVLAPIAGLLLWRDRVYIAKMRLEMDARELSWRFTPQVGTNAERD